MITVDIMFDRPDVYQLIKDQRLINPDLVAKTYGDTGLELLDFLMVDAIQTIKMNFKRRAVAGSANDKDVYGSQFYVPLLHLNVEIED